MGYGPMNPSWGNGSMGNFSGSTGGSGGEYSAGGWGQY